MFKGRRLKKPISFLLWRDVNMEKKVGKRLDKQKLKESINSKDEALKESPDNDKLRKINILYNDAVDYGVSSSELDKILIKNGADPNADTFDIGLDVDEAYKDLSDFLKKEYQPEFDRNINDNNIPSNSYDILGFNQIAYELELARLNKEIANLKRKWDIGESLKEDVSEDEWEEVASKIVEDSDGFMTDYVWYTNGDKHVFVFGDSDIYRPEDGDYDWEIDVVDGAEAEAYKEAQEWFDSYRGFEDEDRPYNFDLDEGVGDNANLYDIQGQAAHERRKQEVIDEFKEIFADGDNGSINIDDEGTKDIVKAFLEDRGYVVETSENGNNPAYPIHIEWYK